MSSLSLSNSAWIAVSIVLLYHDSDGMATCKRSLYRAKPFWF